ncbi:MAG TPA: hypothetical protein VFJ13_07100 [Paracoccaceae bacterium]|nr:hypothetical protein [Paracoccaceae bacterium]
MRTLLAALLLMAVPALADDIVSPEEFREYAEGYTVYFERNGQPFGSESFEPGGKTRWRFNDGSCVRGVWQPQGAQLCFLYDMDSAGPLCWRMLRDDEGMVARLLDGPDAGMEIRIIGRDKAPLLCGEPGRST